MGVKNTNRLELNKILSACSGYAVTEGAKASLIGLAPSGDIDEVRRRLATTAEADRLLFRYGVGKVEYFPDLSSEIVRAQKGATLSCGELMNVNLLLRSARAAYEGVSGVEEFAAENLKSICSRIYYDKNLEDDIAEKIISADAVSDRASDALFAIRQRIKSLNERIRNSLAEYAAGKDAQFLQSGTATIRNDRFVIPVKAEYKSRVKGLVHDRSQSGATYFIEPEYVLNLNNELIALTIDEKQEVERILKLLSSRVGKMAERLALSADALEELDGYFARAEYSYFLKATCPKVNKRGKVDIIKGRHPLIDAKTVVPVSVSLGENYNFLLLSGANTGGKTVTLKMIGLFCLMAECGIFIPAAEGSSVCAFDNIYCAVGDSQSIERSLSTFSSHITDVVEICGQADADSLVLIDELGGGTNPDEGQAIARAVTEYLLGKGCKGVITTHFTALKESAYGIDGIENASMEFDGATLKPLYRIKIGLAGASNALAISRRLGMSAEILSLAEKYLSEGGRNLDNIVKKAEESRAQAQKERDEAAKDKAEWEQRLAAVTATENLLEKERERLGASARTEARRIINERTARAEEILREIEEIFAKEEISQADLVRARTLKNRLADEAYEKGSATESALKAQSVQATAQNVFVGGEVFVKTLASSGTVISVNPVKGEAEVACGSIRVRAKFKDILINPAPAKKPESAQNVRVVRRFSAQQPLFEINVIGMNVEEALYEVENFLDKAVTDNLEEVKIIHGVGTGKLRAAIAARLKKSRAVKSFRSGNYGEGEIGVTIVTLK